MKIGLLTLPIETGYGSIMQALALKTALSSRGHDVILLRRLRKRKKYDIKRIIRRCIKKILYWDTVILIARKEINEYPYVTQNTQAFVDGHLKPYSPIYYSSEDMSDISALGLDAVVVGSDQVWRPGCMENIEDYFLCPIAGLPVKRYAYAASFGVDEWIYSAKETEACKRAVKCFDKVSVREDSGVILCREHLDKTAEFVLDPTLLFDKEFYTAYIGKHHDCSKEHKVCAFILDRSEEKLSILERLSHAMGKEYIFAANNTEDREAPLEERIAPSVESWLDSFNSSDAVFTDSFHGCAFSIIFRKDFYVYINKGRGTGRFRSLLKLLGLEHRVVNADTDFSSVKPIDWEYVEKRLEEMQKISNDFLDAIC